MFVQQTGVRYLFLQAFYVIVQFFQQRLVTAVIS
jgi:hypothetical protein